MSTMLIQVLTHTPRWVFVLFFALLALGVQQMFPRTASLRKVSLLPVAMGGYSLYGVVSSFGQPVALLAWALGAALSFFVLFGRPAAAGTRYDASRREFRLPGSAVPLALMMGLFFIKYGVGVTLSFAPQLASHTGFALPLCALYGFFSGVFAARTARLWKLAGAEAVTLHTAAA